RLRNPGSSLSGGEQQMLAIARALVIDPTVMLLDEPSQGLAPKIVAELSKLIRQLAEEGMTILLVEQNLRLTEAVGDRILVMQKGQIVHDGSGEEFRANGEEIRRRWLTA
ncbi:MAG: ATP-binding cassette domain-containing protein, partial [Burkholderiales bacterium]